MQKLIKFFVTRSLLVNLITVFIIIMGVISLTSINRESYPHIERKRLVVSTSYPGASPNDVESSITIPLEEALKGINGIKEYTSTSVKSFSRIRIVLEDDVKDVRKVKNNIRRAVDNVNLPKEITKRPNIWEWDVASFSIMEIGIFSKSLSYKQLRTRAKDLKKKLLECPYISQVEDKGILEREIKIKLNLRKLQENYISIQEVINAVRVHNIEITGGTFKQENIDKIITVFSKFESLDDVKNIIVRSTFEGNKIYLRDIADIQDDFKEEIVRFRFNGDQGISIEPQKKASADIIKTTDEIKKIVKYYKKSLKDEDIDIVYLSDDSHDTRMRLRIVSTNALIGFAMVICMLFLFMNFKNAFWTAAGIPLSIAFALIFFKSFDVTINSVSLLGIIVVIGMVVDDAIIISENIFRHRLLGKTSLQASLNGTLEVAYPVITTVLTTIIAFLPLYSLKGIVGDFAKEIPLVVMFILAGSLFEAIFILPNHISHNFGIRERNTKIRDRKFIKYMKRNYKNMLNVILNNKILILAGFIVLFIISYFVLFSGKVIKYIEFPSEEATSVYIYGKVKEGQSLDFTEEKIKTIENALKKYPKKVMRSFGTDIGDTGYPENFFIVVNLTPPSKRKTTSDSIISNIRKEVEISGYFTNVYFVKESGGPPVGRSIQIQIRGNDNKQRRLISDKIYNYFVSVDGTKDITRSDEENKKELKILVDYNKSARAGISPYVIGETIRAAFNGVIATDIKTPDETIFYRVVLEDKYRNSLSTLNKLKVMNNQNKLVKLSQLIRTREQNLISKINHYNGERTTIIEADTDKKIITPTEIYARLKKEFSNFDHEYPGYRMIIGGEAKQSKESIQSIIRAFLIAVSIIFFMLILLFKSMSQSFIVILAIPFSLIGIAIALLVHGMPLSYMALFGMVGLTGIVVNDSLVMVNYINTLKNKYKKKKIKDIIIEGAATRLRPVLLTTITTISGLIPTAYAIGGKDPMIIPTTIVISWGLLFATSLTLILIPILYLLENEIRRYIKDFFQILISKFKTVIPILIIILFLSNSIFAQNNKILKLNDFIKDCINNNPEIFSELEKIKIAETQEIQSKAIHDIYFNAHYYRIYEKPFSITSSGTTIDKSATDNIGANLSWIAPYLGTRLKGGMEYSKNKIDYSGFDLPTGIPFEQTTELYSPEFFVNINQPLLKNWFGIVDDFPIKQAKFNKFITEQTVDESIENIIVDLYNLYFDWYVTHHQFNIYSTNVRNSETLLDQINRKFRADLADRSDLSRIKIMNIEYKKARDLYHTIFQNMSKKIYKWQKGVNTAPEELNIKPEKEINIPGIDSSHFSVSNTRQMKILNLSKQLLMRTLNVHKNELLPELNFIFSYSIKNYTQDDSKIFDEFDYKNYTVGMELNYPIGNLKSKGQINETRSRLRQWDYDLKKFERNYVQGYKEVVKILNVYINILKYDRDLMKQAEILIREEERKYRQGRSDFYFIIDNKNTFLKYNLTYIQDYVTYKKYQIQLLGLMDQLKVRSDID